MRSKQWLWAALAAMVLGAAPVLAEEDEEVVEVEAAEGDESAPSSDAVFEFLVAEVAAQRGDVEGALAIYNRLARDLRDSQVARRGVELAIRSRLFGPALESAALLLELDPESTLAREIISALLGNENDIGKARQMLSNLLDRNSGRGALLMQMPHFFSKYPDKAKVLEAVTAVAARYPDMAESHYAVGVAALVAEQPQLAARKTDEALQLRPAWEQAAILKAQVLRRTSPQDIVGFYREFLAGSPGAVDVRMQLGRELASERKLTEAREQFQLAEKASVRDAQAPYAVGLLSLQLEDFAEAQGAFTRALKLGYREPAAIYLGMGQASEGLKRYEEAIGWYQKVDSGDWVRAQLKIGTLISRQQGLQAGRDYLARIEPRSSEDRIQIVQVEAQLLREAKQWRETFDLLSKAVLAHPESHELLYDRAMSAERVEKLEVLEADLRRVIRMKPDYAHAYNALGYTLAEKTDRLEEARELIEKAHKLAPDDPFIMDSVGWVHFRLGNVEEALKHLQRAYTARPDPEIAAHLGEVLWRAGQHDEAQKIWRAALTENPNHETLIAVMQKYRP